jgi:hypothetical protein
MHLRQALLPIILAFTGTANALDSGECAAPEAMTAKLKAEGQRTIATADRITVEKDLFAWVVTVNADRSVGYILQSDKPTGERGSKFCVWTRMANVRLFDARKTGLDPSVLLKASDADALRQCDVLAKERKIPRATCGAYNTMTRKAEAMGHHVMLQGFGVEKRADGSYQPNGTLATVAGNVNGKLSDDPDHPGRSIGGALTYSSLPDGATIINAGFIYPEYTPYGLWMLDGK